MGSIPVIASLLAVLAPSGAVSIHWEGPSDCADAHALVDQVDALVSAQQSTPDIDVTATVEALEPGYRLSLFVRSGSMGLVREIEARSCEELKDAAALIIAVAARPPATASAPPSAPTAPDEATASAPTAPDEAAASVPTAGPSPRSPAHQPADQSGGESSPALQSEGDPDAPPDRRDSPTRQRWSLMPSVGVGTYVTTPLTLGIGGAAQWRRQTWGLSVGVTHWLRRTITIEQRAEIGVMLTEGALRACRFAAAGPLEIPLCVGGAVGGLHVRRLRGLEDPRPTTLGWGAMLASVGLVVPLTRRVGLVFALEGLVALNRPAIAITQSGRPLELFRIAPAAGRAFLSTELRLW